MGEKMAGTKKIKEEQVQEAAPEDSREQARLREQRLEITGVLLMGIALLALISLFFDSEGFIAEILKRGLHFMFGRRGAIIPVLFCGVTGWYLLRWREGIRSARHVVVLIMLFLWALVVMHFFSGVSLAAKNPEAATEGGGVVGHYLAMSLLNLFGKFGTGVFVFIWLMVATILALNRPLVEVIFGFGSKIKIHRKTDARDAKTDAGKPMAIHPTEYEIQETEPQRPARTVDNVVPLSSKKKQESQILSTLHSMLKEKDKEKPEVKPLEAKLLEVKPLEAKPPEVIPKIPSTLGALKLPDVNLIGASNRPKKGVRLLDQSHQLEETLASFGVQAKVIDIHYGPVITRYDLQPAPGVKVSKIVNLTDDLALALAAKGLRLEAPIPGKAAIGIEVPNHETQIVTFRDMLDSKVFWNSGKLNIALGVDIGGEVVAADLKKMPHLLVAGATGSGKSVCINTIIMSILYKAFPSEVRLIMIDPKMVELSMYNGIPHLMAPVVTEAKKAAGALKLVVDEMERRYRLFAEARVRDLEKYNASMSEDQVLPVIIVIIDELADLMMIAPVEVEDSICRLAQMARATGIHLVVATQRPSVDVITGLIKANIPSRIAFAVSSQIDSRTILDSQGAERLLGQGDMLFSPVGAMKPRRIQGAFVTEKEIEAVIKHWKAQGEPKYQEQFVNIPEKKDIVTQEEDDLFWDAVRIIVENGQASASILQRRLRVGYTRAARLVDMMEAKGMVGAYEGSKPREVYVTARQVEEIKKRNQVQ
jgi:S-DNA-T family DNA segregation ATPase FtsK/SpoIIIE